MVSKHASAHWSGGLKDGKGQVSTESGTLDAPYGFANRFEGRKGANPEELIGAAHASCYAMAMSLIFDGEKLKADAIDVKSTVTLDTEGEAPTISRVHIAVTVKAPGLTDARLQELAKKTMEFCPVSRLLAGAEKSMEAKLG